MWNKKILTAFAIRIIQEQYLIPRNAKKVQDQEKLQRSK